MNHKTKNVVCELTLFLNDNIYTFLCIGDKNYRKGL